MEFIDLKSQYRELKPKVDARIAAVLDHGRYIMGPEVEELEANLAARTGSGHCISVSSGTEALLICLMALDIKPGDEVITTPFTFAATAEVIMLLGALPVFVDIERDTCNIDATMIESAITEKTRAIMPVSLYGQVADMNVINEVASRHGNLPVIEDAAQSFGATYNGLSSCNLSTFGCTSFFPSKPLGCYGDGGAIFTDDGSLAQACREIRVHGQSKRYQHTRLGVGGRMDTLQCAIVLAKLEQFDWELERRRDIGQRYSDAFGGLNALELLRVRSDRDCVWAQYTIFAGEREELLKHLTAKGVPTAVHYPIPLDRQPAYSGCRVSGGTQNSTYAANRVLSLPMGPYLTLEQQDSVIEAVTSFFR